MSERDFQVTLAKLTLQAVFSEDVKSLASSLSRDNSLSPEETNRIDYLVSNSIEDLLFASECLDRKVKKRLIPYLGCIEQVIQKTDMDSFWLNFRKSNLNANLASTKLLAKMFLQFLDLYGDKLNWLQSECVKYELCKLELLCASDKSPMHEPQDLAVDMRVTNIGYSRLFPLLKNNIKIEAFSFDFSQLDFNKFKKIDISPRKDFFYLFTCCENTVKVKKINDNVKIFLSLCDGKSSIFDIFNNLSIGSDKLILNEFYKLVNKLIDEKIVTVLTEAYEK